VREQVVPGPGTARVGRFIGRLGVVSLPAVEAGLDLDQRVVRRHVAKLEAAGWLARAPWIWGEGSVVWLTAAGIESAGLGGARPVKAPPGPTTIAHGVLVGWSAARVERRGRAWRSARELALERERWAISTRERGYTEQLPDLAVLLERSKSPGAVIAESGGRREDRQKMILEAWREAIWAGRYAAVRYDCASASVAKWITRLAKKVGLTGSIFTATVQTNAEQIAALCNALATKEPVGVDLKPDAVDVPSRGAEVVASPVLAGASIVSAGRSSEPDAETPEAAAERERVYREVFGDPEPKPRRRWRR
jgi:hypothetical protein